MSEGRELAIIEGQVVPEPTQPLTLFGTTDPVEVLERAVRAANALAGVLNQKKLFAVISDRKYVTVEGWTLLGSMLGVFAQIEWTRKLEDGWEARAITIVAATGRVIGAGEAQCTRSERSWKARDDYALRAMAQTRAISRALRGPLDFVVKLAGFVATPAEEMSAEYDRPPEQNATTREPDIQGARTPDATPLAPTNQAPLAPAPPVDGHGAGGQARGFTASPPPRTPSQIADEARKHIKSPQADYAPEDMVCASCGKKEFIKPYRGSFFCSKRDGGCGAPQKGAKWVVMSYSQWEERQARPLSEKLDEAVDRARR